MCRRENINFHSYKDRTTLIETETLSSPVSNRDKDIDRVRDRDRGRDRDRETEKQRTINSEA